MAVLGHTPVLGELLRAHHQGTLAHAILLTGPEGVGKTTVAEALAAVLLDADTWPGGLRAHPDHWLEDSDAERIGIARVRAGGGDEVSGPSLQDSLARLAYAGGLRVAVMGRADHLTEPAADCLLKTLEEPPPGTHVILCAAHPERLPATVPSRCQSYALAPVAAAAVAAWLSEEHGVVRDLAATAAAVCGGRPGRALALATTPGALATELTAIETLLSAGGGGRRAALRAAGELAPANTAEGRERALAQLAAWTGFLRDVALVGAGAPELGLWAHYAGAARQWAQVLPPARVADLLARCVVTTEQLAQYAVPRLAFEVLLLDILAGDPPPPLVVPPPRPAGVPERPAATSSTTPERRPRRR